MRLSSLLFAALVLPCAVMTVSAHAHLERATPSDGSVLSAAPRELVLQFSEPAQLTALALEPQGGALRKLTLPGGAATQHLVIPLPPLAAGEYRISWRVVGADGHVVPGQIRFTVRP